MAWVPRPDVTDSVHVGGRLVVITHKACWEDPASPSGYSTDGGFPFQMRALSGLVDEITLLLPRAPGPKPAGAAPLQGSGMRVVPLAPLPRSWRRRVFLPFWLLRNLPIYQRWLRQADAIHALVPGDVGTIGMVMAVALGRPLLVRHCGNWCAARRLPGALTQGLMERWAGGKRVMLATGGGEDPPSPRQPAVRWIFSTSLTEEQLRQQGSARKTAPGARARLIIACRQEPAKGTAHVIDSLPALAREFEGITLDVLGDGSAVASLRARAEALGVSQRARFLGQVDHATVMRRLREADVFVFPTVSSEGFPKAVLEAMACGLPVVTTAVSVLPSLVGRGAGVILTEATGAAVASEVAKLLRAPARYLAMSRQAVETAAGYSLERWREAIGEQLLASWGSLSCEGADPVVACTSHR